MSQGFPNNPNKFPPPGNVVPPQKGGGSSIAIVIIVLCAGFGVMALCACLVLPALLLPAVQQAREAARRTVSANNLKEMSVAIHNYHDVHRSFPRPNSNLGESSPGTGNHSWRTQILPFLETGVDTNQIDWNSDWNSSKNRMITDLEIPFFKSPSDESSGATTSYVAIVDVGTAMDPTKKIAFRDIVDGSSNTILLIENVNSGIKWAEPRDVTIDEAIQIIRSAPIGTNVCMCDGSVQYITKDVSEEKLRAMMTASGGESIY